MSGMVSLGDKNYKYFIGYKDDYHEIKPLHIMLPKTSVHVKHYYGCVFSDESEEE